LKPFGGCEAKDNTRAVLTAAIKGYFFMTKRDTCIFYRSMYEGIKDLPKETQAEIYDAIFSYSLDFEQKELTGIAKTIWTFIEPVLTKGNTNYINGSKPKSKRMESEIEAKSKRIKSETEAYKYKDKDKYKHKDNNNFKKWGKEDLIKAMTPYAERYPKNMLNEFFNYWAEPLANGKLRLTAQDAWDTARRLVTWSKRDKDNKPQNSVVTRASMGVKMQ
jgi:hypothetical protein